MQADQENQNAEIQLNWELEDRKLNITVQLAGTTYQASKSIHADIDFDNIKDALNNIQFQILDKTSSNISLKVANLEIELHNLLTLNENKSTS